MASGKNIISTSKKEIYTKLLNIAGKYMDIENNDFAKTGLFGYITESMAMALRDTTFHTGMLYNEFFLNTASIPKTIYNWAKMFNIEVQKAEPAYADIVIKIPESSLTNMSPITSEHKEKYGSDISKIDNGIILDKESPIIAGDYYFSLEHSIIIYKDSDAYKAKYILSEDETTNYEGIVESTKSREISYASGNYEIKARAYQYKMNIYDRQLTSLSFLNKVQTYEFDDQFCGAKLYAVNNNKKTLVNLQYSDLRLPGGIETAFYNLSDEHELEIIFKYGDEKYFMPGANTNLLTYIYTTKGRNVPSTFSGVAVMQLKDTTFKNLPISIVFQDSNIIGGKNVSSLSNIKDTIINEISTRNTITTTEDLNNYFAIITSLIGTVNDGKVTFLKQRDDILRRLYNAYLLIRNRTNDISGGQSDSSFVSPCVPTNTIDVIFDFDDGVSGTEGFKLNTLSYPKFVYNSESDVWQLSNEITTDYYMSPFKIIVSKEPVKFVKYIYDKVNSESKLITLDQGYNFSSGNTLDYISPKAIRVKKNAEFSGTAETYSIEIEFLSEKNFENSTKDGSIKISFEGNANDIEISTAKLNIRSEASNSDGTEFKNIIKITLNSKVSNAFYSAITLYDGVLSDDNKGVDINPKENITVDLSKLIIGGYSAYGKYRSESELEFFQELDSIMESTMSVSTAPATTIVIHDVPVVHSSFFSNTDNTDYNSKIEGFTSQLFSYVNILKENLSRLETSTFFSLKFYNTHGTSYRYETAKTNLDLRLSIKLRSVYSNDFERIQKEIRSYIRRIVDKTNEYGNGLAYSDIVSLVKNDNTYGKYIEYIEFIGINDSYNQYIKPITNSSDYETLVSKAPEWLNIDPNTIDETIQFK